MSTSTESFTNDELDAHIQHTLVEVSQAVPYEDKETLTTTEDSRELDISSIRDNLLEIEKIEYKVDKHPRQYRNS